MQTANLAALPLGIVDYVGIAIWFAGFLVDELTDQEESSFKANPANNGRYSSSRLWEWSLHRSHFGEIAIRKGMAITGVPLIEKIAAERCGGQDDDEPYRHVALVLILKLRHGYARRRPLCERGTRHSSRDALLAVAVSVLPRPLRAPCAASTPRGGPSGGPRR